MGGGGRERTDEEKRPGANAGDDWDEAQRAGQAHAMSYRDKEAETICGLQRRPFFGRSGRSSRGQLSRVVKEALFVKEDRDSGAPTLPNGVGHESAETGVLACAWPLSMP